MRPALIFIAVLVFATAQTQKFIDPTGSYTLVAPSKNKGGEIYGWFGDIKVKLLDSQRIAMTFFICKGHPSYNSGSFVDTLPYHNNIAVYQDTFDLIKGCRVSFTFTKRRIQLQEEAADYSRGNCWGNGVYAFGPYRKYSSRVPLIRHPLTDD